MWVLSWKNYKLSKLATFVSIIGALVRYGGVVCLFSSLILPGIICIAIGIAIHFCAEEIAKAKAKKIIKKQQTVPPVNKASKVEVQTNTQSTYTSAAQSEVPTAPTNNTQTVEGMLKCSQCGAVVSKDDKFCNKCGNKMVKEKKCLRCGKILSESEKFCSECGYQVK